MTGFASERHFTMRNQADWIELGTMEYAQALKVQKSQAEDLLRSRDNRQTIFVVEHTPTITIGTNGTRDHILAAQRELDERGIAVFEVDRGGDVTFHGPGQIVVYPVLHLGPWGNDVGEYVRRLEEVSILAVSEVGILAHREPELPGVWVGQNKVCAIGARVRKRRLDREFITSHGIALNVTTDLSYFDTIVPCGIEGRGVTSVTCELGRPVEIEEWKLRVKNAFVQVFDLEWSEGGQKE